MKDIANSSYGVLPTLRKLKHFTDLHLRKRIADSLVLSRLDYCDSVRGRRDLNLLKLTFKALDAKQ